MGQGSLSRLNQNRRIGYTEGRRKYYDNNKERIRKHNRDYYKKRKGQAAQVLVRLSETESCKIAEILFGGK